MNNDINSYQVATHNTSSYKNNKFLNSYVPLLGIILLISVALYLGYTIFNLQNRSQNAPVPSETLIIEDRYPYQSVPGYDLSVYIDSEMVSVPIDFQSLNLGRFSEVLNTLSYQSKQQLVGFNVSERITPSKIAIIIKDLTKLSQADKDRLVITTTSSGLLVSGYDSLYNTEKPDEVIYLVYLHPNLYKGRDVELAELNTNRTIVGTLFYALHSGTTQLSHDNLLSKLNEVFPTDSNKPLLVNFLR